MRDQNSTMPCRTNAVLQCPQCRVTFEVQPNACKATCPRCGAAPRALNVVSTVTRA